MASMACVVALVGAAHFRKTRTTAGLLCAAIGTVYAVQFRPESLVFVPVAASIVLDRWSEEVRRPRFWWIGLLCLVLLATHMAHLIAVRHEPWGTPDARFSLRYVAPNLAVNGPFYLGDERFPFVYTLLALVGLITAGDRVLRRAAVLHFAVFFAVGLFFYAGSYNYGADVRYSLMTYPPIAMLGGLGAARLAAWLDERLAWSGRRVVTAGIVFQFLWYAPVVRATTEEAWAARADVRYAETLPAALPWNSYVLTHNPGMFHLWGVNAGQMSLVVHNPGRLQYLNQRYAGGVYLHWNFWCNVADPVQQQICRDAAETAPTELVGEYRERDQRFALYRFRPPEARREDAASASDGPPSR
jgi:hypothetical protein